MKKILTLAATAMLLAGCLGGPGIYVVEEQRGDAWHRVGECSAVYIGLDGVPEQWFVDNSHQMHIRLTNGVFYTPTGTWRVTPKAQ